MSDGYLFDVSPVEDEDGKKKKKPRKKREEAVDSPVAVEYSNAAVAFLATCIDGARCPLCGLPGDLDLIDRNKWRIVCGWGCGYAWWRDGDPSLIKTERDKPGGDYTLKHGLWAGKTIQQVFDAGDRWTVEMIASHGDLSEAREAAAKFLAAC